MKRYLVFSGLIYYPGGGWNDFVDSYDDLAAARTSLKTEIAKEGWRVWGHVIDSVTGEQVDGEALDVTD